MWLLKILIVFLVTGSVYAAPNCPLYGLGYPKPSHLLTQPGIKTAASSLDSVFSQYIDKDSGTGSERFSYSVEVFSADEEQPLWSHHWTAPNLAALSSTGVRRVDGNTVYRLGSVTKVFTVLTFLAEVGDAVWNEPITKYIPEIAAMAATGDDLSHSIFTPDWNSITIGSLASQMSGLSRDYALLGELTQGSNVTQAATIGFPVISETEIPPCGNRPVCSRSQFFKGLERLPPSFSPFVTPAYSDIGFTLLGYALEKMTGKPFSKMVQDKVIKPLGLSRTFYSAPKNSLGIIPGEPYVTGWAFDMQNESPTGNMYSSSSDLSRVGRAIIQSKLLPPAMTRRWLKPVTFSSDPRSGVGIPWGVRQLPLLKGADSPYQFATTFNKLGNLGKYSALLAVIPGFDIGFSVLAAGDSPPSLLTDIADTLSDTYLPTLVNIAGTQASNTYCGVYKSSDPAVNSSLSIVLDAGPGLALASWISNGTNLLWYSVAMSRNVTESYWDKIRPSVRLYPTGLWDATADGGKRVAFKAVFEDLSLPNTTKPFTTDCSTWVSVAGIMYGSKPLDLFIFNFNAAGSVTSVENAALRNRLGRVEA
ncbi:beta-lactamase/transpeptidase-like protein [Durotheca rogersii]|uniref:beta-lactamase/transpeptidase-like protein n=1 Tax=Durotheca rogersii TaxID=419775 RepID=UPI00221EC361|nr:beta-lactamase/transpeptidase-like protein [Durotheca rogersii]KAI5861322.1 beta-lactamase/transpeptidase-like protein [Durotheca rogersii]